MAKPFFYRITAADFLAEVIQVPESERGQWALNLALDMVSGKEETAHSSFAKTIISEASEFSQKKRDAANKRWNADDKQSHAQHKQTDAQHMQRHARSSTEAVQYSTEDKKEKPIVFSAKTFLKEHCDNDQLISDWFSVRKAKKATNTKTAMEKFIKQVELSSLTCEQVLELCCEKSWSGFTAGWEIEKPGASSTGQGLGIPDWQRMAK